jgi:hypothetical protein
MWALVALSWLFLWPEAIRSRARLRHVAPRVAEQLAEGTLVAGNVPRQRVSAQSTLTWALLLLGTAAAASVVSALSAPTVMRLVPNPDAAAFGFVQTSAPVDGFRSVGTATLAVALGFGVLGAGLAWRHLARLVAQCPGQPNRVLRPARLSGKVNVLFWAAIIAAVAWLQASGTLVLGLSMVRGVCALLLLPGAAVALCSGQGH